jgi:hypothetical protein
MLPVARLALLATLTGLWPALLPPASAQNLVDLSWDPASSTAGVDEVVELRLVATSDGATGQPFSALDTILDWDPALLELLGFDNTSSGYAWFVAGFLPDPDGINGDLSDGAALFTALSQASKPAVATPGVGLVVTTFRFKTLAPTPGTVVRFTPALGQFGLTRVLDYYQPGLVITGDTSATATVTVSGGPTTFCTSKPSSLPACVPTLSGAGATVSKSGLPLYSLTASPVPGGKQPGLLLYTRVGVLAPPANTSFGFLCLDGFLRASAFALLPGGSKGVCDGAYAWDLAAISAYYGNIHVGDTLHVQAWYRDVGYSPPGNANFTNGYGPVVVVP